MQTQNHLQQPVHTAHTIQITAKLNSYYDNGIVSTMTVTSIV